LIISDGRNGKQYKVPIENDSIPAVFFQTLKSGDLAGLRYWPTYPSWFFDNFDRVFDQGYQNTAVVKSSICFIDGDAGILEYRGYPIEELAEKSTFLEVAYLLIYGHLPSKSQYGDWKDKVMKHTFVHTKMNEIMKGFNYDAHPMGMFIR